MSEKNNEFIPEVTINNTKSTKVAKIDGVEQEVEVPAQEGFNLKTRDLDGNYEKKFFMKDLEAVILFDRYQIQSKYSTKPMYMSNEFEFQGPRNNVRVYCPDEKKVIYEGPYAGAKTEFATGQLTNAGTPEKTFDVFTVLYILMQGEVFRFRWKMNQNNNWFNYKDGCREDPESRADTKDYRGVVTKFGLDKKKFGTNEFWACTLQNIGTNDREEADTIGDALEKEMDERFTKKDEPKPVTEESEEISVDEIPF